MVTEHIFDFEWRPLQNYLRDRDIAIPPFAADQESRSDALYNWIVSKGYSGKEGLNLGTYYHISDYGVIGLALLCAENVGDILKVIKAYVKLFNRDIANVDVKPRENYEVEIHISVNFKPEWNDASRQFHVNVIDSATYKLIMDLLGNDFPISALTVPVHGADKTIYEGFFSLPVKHEGSDIIFSFPAHQLNRTLATANPAVFQSALNMAGESFNALLEVEMGGLRQRIELFLESIPDQYPSLVTTAKYLCMNERTVRRRLADEGCTYRQIVDKARKERAIALLLNSSIPVDRISDILGYSETASFRHAFRRWTGQSTTEFRNSFH
ncbi:HTH-type transcriptional regulator VqsM [Pseudomonas aeruginosa]|nr:HTH-type transcriptional regulator VqsM [Pseudomonas aeruginosa]HCA6577975.1 HTH-type transcriptional regulator VqsM [Pseudomonas aeruginosa]HCA6932994.1 HTH-type transcriptional regulator VqsM [Pseudomonas aeruginosa]HCA7561411.1 HTH-type transcriptional regulator VqsM [Pseudomonas aeruginosa]HCA7573018.1 HTH-type transcriptional regulator VqsM [Pseudomonas aeruginosa]